MKPVTAFIKQSAIDQVHEMVTSHSLTYCLLIYAFNHDITQYIFIHVFLYWGASCLYMHTEIWNQVPTLITEKIRHDHQYLLPQNSHTWEMDPHCTCLLAVRTHSVWRHPCQGMFCLEIHRILLHLHLLLLFWFHHLLQMIKSHLHCLRKKAGLNIL